MAETNESIVQALESIKHKYGGLEKCANPEIMVGRLRDECGQELKADVNLFQRFVLTGEYEKLYSCRKSSRQLQSSTLENVIEHFYSETYTDPRMVKQITCIVAEFLEYPPEVLNSYREESSAPPITLQETVSSDPDDPDSLKQHRYMAKNALIAYFIVFALCVVGVGYIVSQQLQVATAKKLVRIESERKAESKREEAEKKAKEESERKAESEREEAEKKAREEEARRKAELALEAEKKKKVYPDELEGVSIVNAQYIVALNYDGGIELYTKPDSTSYVQRAIPYQEQLQVNALYGAFAYCIYGSYTGWVKTYYLAEVRQESEDDIHTYQLVVDDCTWTEAFYKAKDAGGYLAHINSQEEFDTIISQIYREGKDSIQFRIGGRRDFSSHKYYWVDENNETYGDVLNNTSYWAYGQWMKGEPSYLDGSVAESYVDFYFFKQENRWVWNDVPDDIIAIVPGYRGKLGYVIEFD